MGKGKVSIIIPAYNAERYISNCIESLLDQTYDDIEIIIVNDGSEDNTKHIIDKYAAVDKRIIAVHLENGGVSTARNKGLEISSGSYVTFVDSDDWVEPDMLSFAVNKIKETKADIVIWSYFKNYIDKQLALSLLPGGSQVFTNNIDILFLRSIYQMYGEDRVRESVSAGAVWCKLYKKEILKENNLKFNKGLIRAQDTIFSLNAFLHASKIVYCDVNLYHYRITNTSTCSGTRFINNTEEPFNLLLDEFSNFITTNNNTEPYQAALYARTIQVLMWHLKHNYFHSKNKKGFIQKRKEILALIEKEPYKTALSNVENKLLPKKEKLLTMLFRYRLIFTFYAIYSLHNKLSNTSEKKYK